VLYRLLVLLTSSIFPSVQLGFVQTEESDPLQLQFVPTNVSVKFNLTNPLHPLAVTVYGNVSQQRAVQVVGTAHILNLPIGPIGICPDGGIRCRVVPTTSIRSHQRVRQIQPYQPSTPARRHGIWQCVGNFSIDNFHSPIEQQRLAMQSSLSKAVQSTTRGSMVIRSHQRVRQIQPYQPSTPARRHGIWQCVGNCVTELKL
jgi:hypothetical protein